MLCSVPLLLVLNFYPRSPRGERRHQLKTAFSDAAISIHALLAESDRYPITEFLPEAISIHALLAESDMAGYAGSLASATISIHALLAESDLQAPLTSGAATDFYPRSPRGERHANLDWILQVVKFLSTLSSRRATRSAKRGWAIVGISIHALLAESDPEQRCTKPESHYFYPRSPRGERHESPTGTPQTKAISIHALLAESDR